LGNGQHLSISEIRKKKFEFIGVDLLTLSACNTAMGGVGSEFEGFGSLAIKKGASAVIATLWSVADESTAVFMKEMYDRMFHEPKMTKAEVIHETQLSFINKKQTKVVKRTSSRGVLSKLVSLNGLNKKDYSHPYYWAPFILMGY